MDLDFETLFKSIKIEVASLAKKSPEDSLKEAKADAMDVLNSMKANIEKWSLQVANKEMTIDEFKFVLETQREEMEMVALKEAGLKEIELDKFKNGIVGLLLIKLVGWFS